MEFMEADLFQEGVRRVRDYVSALRWGSQLRDRAEAAGTPVERKMKMLSEASQMETSREAAMMGALEALLLLPKAPEKTATLALVVEELSRLPRLTRKAQHGLARAKRALFELRRH